jgi:hypothetical protein
MPALFGHKRKGPHVVTEVDVETGKVRKVSVKPMTKEQRQAYIDKHKTKKGGRRRGTRRRTLRRLGPLARLVRNPTRRELSALLRR